MFSHVLQTIIVSLLLRDTLAAPVEIAVPSTNATGTYKAPIGTRDGGSAPPKLVVAHMMVGNTYSYSVDTWAADIKLASANGIDGFALNIGSAAPFTDAQVANA
jgi:glucan endo-1,3-alpha-glucosidase